MGTETFPFIHAISRASNYFIGSFSLFPFVDYAKVNWNTIEMLNVMLSKADLIREITLSDEFSDPSILRSLKWMVYFQ
jgi:hypothetical protein